MQVQNIALLKCDFIKFLIDCLPDCFCFQWKVTLFANVIVYWEINLNEQTILSQK